MFIRIVDYFVDNHPNKIKDLAELQNSYPHYLGAWNRVDIVITSSVSRYNVWITNIFC